MRKLREGKANSLSRSLVCSGFISTLKGQTNKSVLKTVVSFFILLFFFRHPLKNTLKIYLEFNKILGNLFPAIQNIGVIFAKYKLELYLPYKMLELYLQYKLLELYFQ